MTQPHYQDNVRGDEDEPRSHQPLHKAGEHLDSNEPQLEPAHDGPASELYIHPEAADLFMKYTWSKHIPLFSQTCKGFGPKGTLALGLCYFLNKGLGSYLVNFSRYAMLRDRFGIDGTRYQRLSTLRTMGWSVKAFSACVSDTFALFGYTKRWYCAGSCVAGAAFALAYGLLPAKESSANIGAGFLFLTSFCMANIDILSEGHYSRILRKRPDAGPHLVSWIWVFIFTASLIAASINGPLADKGIPQTSLFISAACQVLTVFFFIFNWYGERYNRVERHEDVVVETAILRALEESQNTPFDSDTPVNVAVKDLHPELAGGDAAEAGTPHHRAGAVQQGELLQEELTLDNVHAHHDDLDDELEIDHSAYITTVCFGAVEINREVFSRNWRLYVYSTVMVAAVVAQCLVTVFGNSHDLGWSSLAVAVACCSMAFWACKLVAAKAIVFVFLDMLLYLQLPGVMDSFYMAKKECYPEGPHFTYVFYNTVATVIGDLGGIAGVFAFSYLFSKRSYWLTFIVTTIVKVMGSVFDIIIVKRWNLAIGIPDHAMYIMGDAIVYEVCHQFAWMPVVLLFSRICPRGSESMIYALAAGFSNMGQSMSNAVGSLFIELVWPIRTKIVGDKLCDFTNVPMLLLVAHILLPLLIIPASFILLPRARICDDLDADGVAIPHDKKTPVEEQADLSTSRELGSEVEPVRGEAESAAKRA